MRLGKLIILILILALRIKMALLVLVQKNPSRRAHKQWNVVQGAKKHKN